MTELTVNKRRLLQFTSVQHTLLYGTFVAYNLTFWEETPHAVVPCLVAKQHAQAAFVKQVPF